MVTQRASGDTSVTARLDPALAKQLKKAAIDYDLTISAMVEAIIREFFASGFELTVSSRSIREDSTESE